MKNKILNSIILTTAALVGFLAFTAEANASTTFNTNSLDYQTLRVSNYTLNPGCSNCWYSNVSATAGQVVSVEVYYHNTGNENAIDTRIKVSPQFTGAVSNQTFSGGVSAQNASFVGGSATVNISGTPQTITFIPGTVRLYKDKNFSSPIYFSNSQELELFGSAGIPIGDILPPSTCPSGQTFCHQGTLVARFQIGSMQPSQCSDGIDNDGDGLIDYPADPGCSSPTDNSEVNSLPTYQCNDGIDNDGDGLIDFPQDPGCSSYTDNSEYTPPLTYQCNDGI